MDDTNSAEAAMAASASEEPRAEQALPAGEYAIVEVLGHRTLIGRIDEIERFGAKLMSIEPIFQGVLLPAVMIGGGSIYQLTPCSAEVALARAPKEEWQVPVSIRATLPSATGADHSGCCRRAMLLAGSDDGEICLGCSIDTDEEEF